MSYNIGQIRKSSSTMYLASIEGDMEATAILTEGFTGSTFSDYAIRLKDGTFNANHTYYLRFSIKRINDSEGEYDSRFLNQSRSGNANDPRVMNLTVELFKTDGSESDTKGRYETGTYQIIDSSISIEPFIRGRNTEYASYEIIFTPNDSYEYLGFVLARTPYDYLYEPRDDVKTGIKFGDMGDLCIIDNVLPRASVDKIGIQGRPGSLLCINKEAVRIGRSGTYEVNNGVPILFVGFTAPNGSDNENIDKFILDYAWDES